MSPTLGWAGPLFRETAVNLEGIVLLKQKAGSVGRKFRFSRLWFMINPVLWPLVTL